MVQNAIEAKPVLGPRISNFALLNQSVAPEKFVDHMVFLCSPPATYINVAALPLDECLTLPAPTPLLM